MSIQKKIQTYITESLSPTIKLEYTFLRKNETKTQQKEH